MSKKNVILNKWTPLLEAEGVPAIAHATRSEIIASIFESQEQDINKHPKEYALTEAVVAGDHGYTPASIAAGTNSGAAVNIGPTVMGMVRRAIPNMIAFDICGVQPMSVPTGQIFSIRAMYGKNPSAVGAKEAFHPISGVDASYSGKYGTADAGTGTITAFGEVTKDTAVVTNATVRHTFVDGKMGCFTNISTGDWTPTGDTAAKLDAELLAAIAAGTVVEISEGMATSVAELMESFNGSTGNAWNEMSFRIDKQTIEAKSRQLKAQYSIELAQDLQAVHGINADSELSKILATEMLLEINREIILWINATAQVGKTGWTNLNGGQAGVFNFNDPSDTRGARWAGESYKSLIIQIDKEANEISRQTGRGAGNFIIASRNLVAALGHTDMLIGPAVQGTTTGFNVDTNQSVYAGVLAGKYRVYIDQYAQEDYFTVGYKGASEMDAGIYYCPYVPLTPLRGVDPKNFQPVMGFKTRYAVGINPMADSSRTTGFKQLTDGMPTKEMFGKNAYFRRVYVKGL
jgi:hypothetical protein